MKKNLTIFLCSTYSDLVDERDGVIEAARKLKLQHNSMEFFGARSGQPIETCLDEVRQSDLLIVIIGHRYGSLVPGTNISFSEAEYSEGYRLKKPCLVYLRDDDVPILPKHMERNPQNLQALEHFKHVLQERHTVSYFKGARDLAISFAADVTRSIQALETAAAAEQHSPSSSSIQDEIVKMIEDALEKQVSESLLLSTLRQAISSLLTTEGKRLPLVFLSYSNADGEFVRAFAEAAQANGINVWSYSNKVTLGEYLSDISQELYSADFIVFFMSKASMASKWVQHEISLVMARRLENQEGPRVLPVLLEDVEITGLLRDMAILDLRDKDVARGVPLLSAAIERSQLFRYKDTSTRPTKHA